VNVRSRFAIREAQELSARHIRCRDRTNPSKQENTISASDGGEQPTVVTKDRARQGVTGHNVRYVLSFGLAAIIVLFVAVYLAYFG
jgi:hypothetical protein